MTPQRTYQKIAKGPMKLKVKTCKNEKSPVNNVMQQQTNKQTNKQRHGRGHTLSLPQGQIHESVKQ